MPEKIEKKTERRMGNKMASFCRMKQKRGEHTFRGTVPTRTPSFNKYGQAKLTKQDESSYMDFSTFTLTFTTLLTKKCGGKIVLDEKTAFF